MTESIKSLDNQDKLIKELRNENLDLKSDLENAKKENRGLVKIIRRLEERNEKLRQMTEK